MSNATQQTIVIVNGALFSAEGKLLLLRASDRQWEMPGGPIDFGESPEPALVRCFAEATDIDISTDRPLGAWCTLERSGETSRHFIHIDYTVKCSGALMGVEIDRNRHAEFAWLARAEALSKMDSPAERQAIERAFNMLARTRRNG